MNELRKSVFSYEGYDNVKGVVFLNMVSNIALYKIVYCDIIAVGTMARQLDCWEHMTTNQLTTGRRVIIA